MRGDKSLIRISKLTAGLELKLRRRRILENGYTGLGSHHLHIRVPMTTHPPTLSLSAPIRGGDTGFNNSALLFTQGTRISRCSPSASHSC